METILADYYHLHHQEYDEDLPFWLALAEQQGGAVLELGCGTGRVLFKLAQAGFTVWGLDHDEKMIDVLKKKSAGVQGIQCHKMDMTDFQISERFPLIILPCNTFSTLSENERSATLGRVNHHLAPGGVFAVSIPNPAQLAQLPEEADPEIELTFTHPHSGEPVQVSSAWRKGQDAVTMIWHYDHLLPNGRIERSSVETQHHLTEMKQYLGEFIGMGWDVKTYGDFDFTPYETNSPYLILVGQHSKGD